MKLVVKKSVYQEILKSLFDSSEHPRGAGGKFIKKLSPNTGLGGGSVMSNTQRRIALANQAQNISQEEPNIKELNVSLKDDFKSIGKDYIENTINKYLAENNVVCDVINKRVSRMISDHIYDDRLHNPKDQLKRTKILPFILPIIEMYGEKGDVTKDSLGDHQEIVGKAEYNDPDFGKIKVGIVVALSDNGKDGVTANVITTYPIISRMIKSFPVNDTVIHP